MGAILALTAVRLAFAAVTELLPEEAYYWMYSQHPALGYFDHPPMIAWLIGAGTAMTGDVEIGVRLWTVLLSAATAGLLFALGRDWFGVRAGLASALAYALLPVFAGAASVATPDQGLLFFWVLALLGFSNGVRTGRWAWWLCGGAAFGGALLSKYYAVMLGPSLLLFLLASPEHRRWLVRPHPWVAFGLALAAFSPVILWNSQNDWASFLFQAGRTSSGEAHPVRDFLRFWGVQAAVLTPLGLAWLGVAVAHGAVAVGRRRDTAWTFALAFSLPLFLLFTAASLKTEVHVNWTAPAFLSLLPGAAALFLERWDAGGRGWRIAAWATGALCIVAMALGLPGLAWGTPRFYEQAGGWKSLSREVAEAARALPARNGFEGPFVLGTDKYDFAAEMGFYMGEPHDALNDYAIGSSGLGFKFWRDLQRYKGRDAIAIAEEPRAGLVRKLRRYFREVGEPRRVTVLGPGLHSRTVYLIACYEYRPKKRK